MSRTAAALVALLALYACSLEPTYRRPDAAIPAAYPAGAPYRVEAPGATPPAAAPGWRDFLRDARLQRLVELALHENRDLRVAALNVAEVQAQYRIQRSQELPSVVAFGQASRGGGPVQSDRLSRYSTGLDAAWEIDLFGRLRSLSHAVLEQYFATRDARRAVQVSLIAQVADQYLSMLALDEQQRITEQTLTTAQSSLAIVRLQFQAGTGTELAVRQAETVVEQARANAAAQARERAQAENALVLLLGAPLPADLPPAVPLGAQALLADIPAGLPSDLLERRPDILQAESVLRAENANIGAARAAFFPHISLTATAGIASESLSGLFDNASRAWTFIPSITQPIFQGGSLKASLDLARLQRDVGVAQYQKAVQTAFREVADGLAARGTYDTELDALERDVLAQRRRLELSDFRFRNGVDSYLNVLTAQTDLYNAEQALVTARLQRLTALVDLYRALGGGWSAQKP